MLKKRKYILGSVLLMGLLIGCGGGSSSSSDNNISDSNDSNGLIKEFVSLDKRANVEAGYLLINGEKKELNYSGALQATGTLAIFNDNILMPLVVMSSDKQIEPNYLKMRVVQVKEDNSTTVFECTNMEHKKRASTVIADSMVDMINAKGCKEIVTRDDNDSQEPKITDVELVLSDSLLRQGASRIQFKEGKAYLYSRYYLNSKDIIASSLGTRTYNQIFDMIKEHPEIKTLVTWKVADNALNQDIMLSTARLIRKAGLNTLATNDSLIHASGIELFVAGVQRTVEENASIYLNAWEEKLDTLDRDDTAHKSHLDIYKEMLGDAQGEEFYFYMLTKGVEQSYKMTQDEIVEYGLSTQ